VEEQEWTFQDGEVRLNFELSTLDRDEAHRFYAETLSGLWARCPTAFSHWETRFQADNEYMQRRWSEWANETDRLRFIVMTDHRLTGDGDVRGNQRVKLVRVAFTSDELWEEWFHESCLSAYN
jgi:hypothetical protein